MEKPISIIGSGCYLPAAIDSSVIETKYGIPLGWSERYSGVKSRHHVTFESNAYMGARAVENACENAKISLQEIDLMIFAGATYDHPLPHQSSLIKYELSQASETHFPTFDIDSTCLSFLAAQEVACAMLDGKRYKTIVVVSSEIASKGLSANRHETLTLFGDAAAAFVFRYDENKGGRFIKSAMQTYSEGVHLTMIKGGGNKYFFKDHPYDEDFYSFEMEGMKLLKLAKRTIPGFLTSFFSNLSCKLSDADVVISHQASRTGLDLIKSLIDIEADKFYINLENRGNCIAASIPLLLHETIQSGQLKRGDYCVLMGSSAGFSLGTLLFRY